MNFEQLDEVPLLEFGYWSGAVRQWYKEGLQEVVGIPSRDEWPDGRAIFHNRMMGAFGSPDDYDIMNQLGFDKAPQRVPINCFLCPAFEERILEDLGDRYTWIDQDGAMKLEDKERISMPQWLSWAVSSREDWEQVKVERLRPTLDGRLPQDWDQKKDEFKGRDYPLIIGDLQGFYGTPRRLLGPEQVLYAFYDQPGLVQDMINYLCDFWIALYDQVLDWVNVDAALIWEDMCYKSGPLISPAMFREFILPAYKRLTAFLRGRGIEHIFVDTDGNCEALIPLFIEGGITGIFPFEVAAGMDIIKIRESYPRLQMLGGIDKQKVAKGKRAIDRELESKIPFMLEEGGFVPSIDHTIPPDISWQNFVYYRTRIREMVQAIGQT
jgi:uroporphyrinogen decarboxylase